MTHIAIIGTGLSGLATGWFLLNVFPHQKIEVTFFDPLGIGGSTSGMAAGLMHPYSGASAKLNRHGLEGYLATVELIKIASDYVRQPIVTGQGLLRLAITKRQKSEYHLCSQKYDLVTWLDQDETVQRVPGLSSHPGIFIQNSLTIDCPLYLEGLWKACEERGAKLEKFRVNSCDELGNYDQIIIATGASVNQLLSGIPLPITEVKGQVLELAWPQNLEPLPIAINSHAYLLMNKEKHSCIVGATYERDFTSSLTDIAYASQDILPKAVALVPELKKASILDCRAGIRASTPDHLPMIKKIDNKRWVITGMGSKGLLYHALYAKKLAEMLVAYMSISI